MFFNKQSNDIRNNNYRINNILGIFNCNSMDEIVLTKEEIWMASIHLIQVNKKKYNRKEKHKNIDYGKE